MILIKMFGTFDIILAGSSLLEDINDGQKSVNLLQFLLANKGKNFLPEDIANSLWSSNDYIDPKKVVRTYIHRLKKLMDAILVYNKSLSEYILIENTINGYGVKIHSHVDLDTEQFEILCKEIEKVKDIAHLKELSEQLLQVYTGDFLMHLQDESWTIWFRNQYKRYFCQSIQIILSIYQDNQLHFETIQLCEKALQICETDETIHIHYLEALYQTDQIKMALEHYGYATRMMYRQFAQSPSDEMRGIYAKLKQNTHQKKQTHLEQTPTVEDKDLIYVVTDVLRSMVDFNMQNYTLGFVKIESVNQIEGPEMKQVLEKTFEEVLRRNDMYAIINHTTGIALLKNAKKEFRSIIENRLVNVFAKHSKRDDIKLEITILPIQNVL